MIDKYVEHIEKLNHMSEAAVWDSWAEAEGIFAYACKDQKDTKNYGCLTMIRGNYEAETPELTEAIHADIRIPSSYLDIRPEHYEVFAEWQRRIDKELGRA